MSLRGRLGRPKQSRWGRETIMRLLRFARNDRRPKGGRTPRFIGAPLEAIMKFSDSLSWVPHPSPTAELPQQQGGYALAALNLGHLEAGERLLPGQALKEPHQKA